MKSSKSRIDHRSADPAATLLRHTPTPKLVETAHSVLYKIFFTDRLPRENARGAWKGFQQETGVGVLHCEEGNGKHHNPSGLAQSSEGECQPTCRVIATHASDCSRRCSLKV